MSTLREAFHQVLLEANDPGAIESPIDADLGFSPTRIVDLFPELLAQPLVNEAAAFEQDLFRRLLQFLNAKDDVSAEELADTHAILLAEEATLFLDQLDSCFPGTAERDERMARRRELLIRLREESGRDDVLFDFVEPEAWLSEGPSESFKAIIRLDDAAHRQFEEDDWGSVVSTVSSMHSLCLSAPPSELMTMAPSFFHWTRSLAGLFSQAAVDGDLGYRAVILQAQPALDDALVETVLELADECRLQLLVNDAVQLYHFGMLISQQLHGEKHVLSVTCRMGFSAVYRELGDHARSLAEALEALETYAFVDGPPDTGIVLAGALAYLVDGNVEWAETLAQRALKSADSDAELNHCRYVLALIRMAQTEYGAAHKMLREVVKEPSSVDCLTVARALHAIALCYQVDGDYAPAVELLKRAVEMRRENLGEHHPEFIESLSLLATQYHYLNDIEGMLTLVTELAASLAGALLRIVPTAAEHQRRSFLAFLRPHFDSCLSHLLLAGENGKRGTVSAAMRLILQWKGIESALAREFTMVLQSDRHRGSHFRELEAGVTTNALEGGRFEIRHPELDGLIVGDRWSQLEFREAQQLSLNREELKQHVRRWLIGDPLSDIRRCLGEGDVLLEVVRFNRLPAQVPMARTAVANGRGSRVDHNSRQGKAAGLRGLQLKADDSDAQRIREEECKTDLEHSYLLFVVRGAGDAAVTLLELGNGESIDQMIADYLSEIIRSAPRDETARLNQIGAELAEIFVKPVVATVPGIERLLLAPDGEVSRLAIGALPWEDGEFVIDAFDVGYLSSGRDLLRNMPAGENGTTPVILGNPDYDSQQTDTGDARLLKDGSPDLVRSGIRFTALPATTDEATSIAAKLGVPPLLGASATKSAVLRSGSPLILHLATHGFFLPNCRLNAGVEGQDESLMPEARWLRLATLEDPLLRSGLALSGANTWLQNMPSEDHADNGLLTGKDLLAMDLRATELVVR